ncbi:MAG: ATP-dependent Clp protease adaptor ClpS [Kiritimatiellae bacterium]|nr:ATP-dependent Clp protease adaptor ClpS [Kiritimatiellia bacterium]MDD5520057.1 ATP-dependent Clp protease adaptor ClpS [Kiritimatiellia bacterium]
MIEKPNKNDPVIIVGVVSQEKVEDMYQVVLHNDNYNDAFYVVNCLQQVFHHEASLAIKIMLEAHNNGKAIAEVEGAESARTHCQQLHSMGLTATAEKI